MARTALEHALPADWIDTVFEAERQRQYSRELLFSTVVELMTLVSLGLRPSLHAAARQMGNLPVMHLVGASQAGPSAEVSLASLYDKINHTEPGILRALVQGAAQRLAPVMAEVGIRPALPGYQVRVLETATTCLAAKSAWGCCAGIAGQLCRGSRSWLTTPTAAWSAS
jgi:hypothetical protein